MNPERNVEVAREAERAVWSEAGVAIKERVIPAGKRRVRIVECGNPAGKPLLLLQGGLGEAFGWAGLMARLSEFRCISLDRPGGGFSDGVDFTQLDPRQLAVEVVDAVLDAAGVDQATLVANSMGGWWAFQFALARPQRVSRLVLLGCPAVLVGTSAPLPMRLMSLPLIGPRMVSLMVPANQDKARTIPAVLGHPKDLGRGWSAAQAEAVYRFGNLPAFRTSWRTLLRRFLTLTGPHPEMQITAEQLKQVTQPTLFLWGSQDPFGNITAGRAAASHMTNARVEPVGVGHLPWWDEPEACSRIVREFVT
jgi:pimeloyl-ACP methyl ester carboxylesterase